MRQLGWNSPWWATALLFGVPFGVLEGAEDLVSGRHGALGALGTGMGTGVFFGLFMTLFTARTRRRLRDSVGVVPGRDERAVSRAATRGPVPADPALREAALRLARFRAEENRRRRIFNLSVFPVFTVGSLLLATSQGLVWLAAAVLFGGLAVWAVFVPRRLADRISALSDPHGTAAAAVLTPSTEPSS